MTVAELIRELQNHSDDSLVFAQVIQRRYYRSEKHYWVWAVSSTSNGDVRIEIYERIWGTVGDED